MKCDELKPLVFSINDLAYVDELAVRNNFDNPHDHAVYKATEVDAAIAELKEALNEAESSRYEAGADPTDIELEHEPVCLKSDVDKVIADKDQEIAELKGDIADLRDDKKSTDAILDERNAELAKLQAMIEERDKTIEELKSDYKEACDRLQTANLIKDEQMAIVTKQNQTISSLRCEVVNLERRVYAANRDARRTRY